MAETPIDLVFELSVSQRVHHLLFGYLRQCCGPSKESSPLDDVASVAEAFLGISETSDYHLIISNTELALQKKRVEIGAIYTQCMETPGREYNPRETNDALHRMIVCDYRWY